jgi:hypothetical protein
MILFTKNNCEKCQWVKDNCDLKNVKIYNLDNNSEALGALAYYECVTIAEKELPILVAFGPEGHQNITGLDNIMEWLGGKNGAVPVDNCGDNCRWEK